MRRNAREEAIAAIETDIIAAVAKLDIPEVSPMLRARDYLLALDAAPAAEPKVKRTRKAKGTEAGS